MTDITDTGTIPSDPPSTNPDTHMAEPLKPAGAGAESIGGTAHAAKEAVKEHAGKIGGEAADRARGFAAQGKDRASEALGGFAKMMEDAAGSVDEKMGAQYGDYARSAAGAVAGFADRLEAKDVDELVDDAREFVRKSPAIAIGTAAAIGFLIARVVKSGLDTVADAADGGDAPN